VTCIFCDQHGGLVPVVGGPIYADDRIYANHYYEGDGPTYLGNLVVTTRRHIPTLPDLTDAEAQTLGLTITRLGRALTACVGAERIYVEGFMETTPHVHVFVKPRYPGTLPEYLRGRIFEWPEAPRGGA
jgi:diadenosine tetraphosphate (Ap4A) HIT family hydrolase